MNEKLKAILDTYEDFELAFLSRYKLSGYMEGTGKSIKEYLMERGLTEERIDSLIEETSKTSFKVGENCPRCKSTKMRSEQVEWNVSNSRNEGKIAAIDGFIGKPTYKNQVICEVCGLFIQDPNCHRPVKYDVWKKLKSWFNRR